MLAKPSSTLTSALGVSISLQLAGCDPLAAEEPGSTDERARTGEAASAQVAAPEQREVILRLLDKQGDGCRAPVNVFSSGTSAEISFPEFELSAPSPQGRSQTAHCAVRAQVEAAANRQYRVASLAFMGDAFFFDAGTRAAVNLAARFAAGRAPVTAVVSLAGFRAERWTHSFENANASDWSRCGEGPVIAIDVALSLESQAVALAAVQSLLVAVAQRPCSP